MLTLFRACELYAPERLGIRDVLIGAGRVLAVDQHIAEPKDVACEVIPADGLRMIPGLIDVHVHIAGAGGEGGPSTRTPEMQLGQMLKGGITSVIGSLGTDGMTRSVESVLMKAKALRQEGVSAWILTGAYQAPTPTILGDAGRDVAMIEEIIGVGEVAVSDHRSSCPTVPELARIAAHARVGGMLGGKAGLVLLHMGDAQKPFDILYQVVSFSQLSLAQFLPTHCTRNAHIFQEAKEYGKQGYVDITASAYPFFPDDEVKPSKAIVELLKAGVPLDHITMSSDGCGSLPRFDEKGNVVMLVSGEPDSIFRELVEAVRQDGLPLELALKVVTSNPARIFKLPRKGSIAAGYDADLVLLDKEDRPYHVVANGAFFVKYAEVLRRGTFEK
ncbi:MAG: beta-aspartyl-peptidase [Acidobacteriota bacterium]